MLRYVTCLSLSVEFLTLVKIRKARAKEKGGGGKAESVGGTEGMKVFIVKS
jgi:hypothetical protein